MHKFNKFQKTQVYHLKTSITSGGVAVWSKHIVHIFYHGLSKSTNEQLVNSKKNRLEVTPPNGFLLFCLCYRILLISAADGRFSLKACAKPLHHLHSCGASASTLLPQESPSSAPINEIYKKQSEIFNGFSFGGENVY